MDDEAAVRQGASAVESAFAQHFGYANGQSEALSATGAIFTPMPPYNDIPVRGTCGVTFISPHYAITAAHCVSGVSSPASTALTVEQYDISAVSAATLADARRVTDLSPYPSPVWSHRTLTETDGYKVRRFNSCYVRKRCGFGPYYCSLPADVALVHCADRPASSPYMDVASSDPPLGGPVSMHWFHEVYDISPATPNPSDPIAADLYNHYVMAPPAGSQGDNFHYLGGGRNQLMPLVSLPWSGGQARSVVIAPTPGAVVWTDLYGCHGTSGSGVYQINSASGRPELLGPVVQAGAGIGSRLCFDGSTISPGNQLVGYTSNTYVNQLAATAYSDPDEWGDGMDSVCEKKPWTPGC
jgi:hypothetical protein